MMLIEQREAMQRDEGLQHTSVVDQTQFRNTQIGVGYQHSTVVRQPTARDVSGEKEKVVDKTPQAVIFRKEKKRAREVFRIQTPLTIAEGEILGGLLSIPFSFALLL